MNKGNFIKIIVFLILSIVVTYGVAIVDALRRNNLFGEGGIPLRFTSGATFLGEASTNILTLILDIIFWFVILFGIWKLSLKAVKR